MDKTEAKALLASHLDELKARSYPELVELIGQVDARQVTGRSGAGYTIELDVMWDGQPGGDLRVFGSIDDGGLWNAFAPLSLGFVITPDGTLIEPES